MYIYLSICSLRYCVLAMCLYMSRVTLACNFSCGLALFMLLIRVLSGCVFSVYRPFSVLSRWSRLSHLLCQRIVRLICVTYWSGPLAFSLFVSVDCVHLCVYLLIVLVGVCVFWFCVASCVVYACSVSVVVV